MSFSAMAWASKQKVKSSTQKLVLLMLANYADDQDKCWPSKQTLADMCCMSKSGICKSIMQLEEAGFLRVEKREGTSSVIRLNTDVHQVDRGVHHVDRGVSTTETGGVHHVDTILSTNQSYEPINKSISFDADFEEFWAAYPKRPNNPRRAAMKAYIKARKKKGVTKEQLLRDVGRYAAFMAGKETKFIAHASTWLNNERWDNDYSEGEQVIKAYNDIRAGAVVEASDLNKIASVYPGLEVGSDDPYKALSREVKAGATVDQIREAAEKYRLLIKSQREQGFSYPLPSLGSWIRFKWREMDGYEFCRIGMNNTLSVRPKRKG